MIKFKDIKSDIREALKIPLKEITEPVKLIDGLLTPDFITEINDNPLLGGPTLPMVALIGDSGRLYFYALKALLPELELNERIQI